MKDNLEIIIGRCPCGNIRVEGKWYSPNTYDLKGKEVYYTDTICSNKCSKKYYGIELDKL
jgi:hypothetical protein